MWLTSPKRQIWLLQLEMISTKHLNEGSYIKDSFGRVDKSIPYSENSTSKSMLVTPTLIENASSTDPAKRSHLNNITSYIRREAQSQFDFFL